MKCDLKKISLLIKYYLKQKSDSNYRHKHKNNVWGLKSKLNNFNSN